jgi:TPR repeat protein
MDPPELPVALTNAGVMHSLALSLPTNLSLAKKYWLRAAAQGDVPAFFWLGTTALKERNHHLATAVSFLSHATRYHVTAHVFSPALACSLAGNASCAQDLFLLCGYLGLAECFAELHEDPLLLRYAFDGLHAASTLDKTVLASELLRKECLTEKDYDLALFAAKRGSAEGFYTLGWFHEQRRELVTARRMYATVARRANTNWAEILVGVISYARVLAKHRLLLMT